MNIKTQDLTGPALDWAVAKCEEVGKPAGYYTGMVGRGNFTPSANWSQGGPIIEREDITFVRCNDLFFPKGNEKGDYYEPYWRADPAEMDSTWRRMYGPTPLIAAMRCYVASKLGYEVDVPEELL